MTDPRRLRLGTRASALARWQAEWTADRLRALGCDVELIPITTAGDVASAPLGQIGGQGLFTKRIQQALLDREVDLAVHSLKDLPTEPVDGLVLAAVPERESPGDVVVSNVASSLNTLPPGARVGTGSRRRQAQLLHYRADLQIADIRGNVETRLRKLDEGDFDAIVLAEAGLTRLGLRDRITQILPPEIMLPAIGQGALGIEARSDDDATRAILAQLDDLTTHRCVDAERALLAALRGGCLAPVGAWGRMHGEKLRLDGVVLSVDGRQRLSATADGTPESAEQIGCDVATQLLSQGAAALIAATRSSEAS